MEHSQLCNAQPYKNPQFRGSSEATSEVTNSRPSYGEVMYRFCGSKMWSVQLKVALGPGHGNSPGLLGDNNGSTCQIEHEAHAAMPE